MEIGKIFICKPGGVVLGEIYPRLENATLKEHLTDIWELSFDVQRYINGNEESPYYSSITERMELLYVCDDNKIRFLIDVEPTVNISASDMTESKKITAHSIECDLQSKQIRSFKVNCGTSDSQEYLVFDEYGRNINAYSYGNAGSRLAIDQIYVDCRMDKYLKKVRDILEDKIDTETYFEPNTEIYNILLELISKCPRVQKHLTYEENDVEVLNCYVFTNLAGEIFINNKNELIYGLNEIIQFYEKYRHKLSLIDLALEQAKEGSWSTWREAISDEIAMSIWNFEVNENQDVYSFLTNTFANYAQAICLFDRYNKKIGVRYISEYEGDEFETGVVVNMHNLANTVDIESTLTDGIKTKMYPTGAENLDISYVNFDPYIIDLDYFMDTKVDGIDEYQFVDEELHNKYYEWKKYCYEDKDNFEYTVIIDDVPTTVYTDDYFAQTTRREAYAEFTRLYNKSIVDIDAIKKLLPNDYCNVDYLSMQYEDLVLYWKAYMNSISTLETLYKSDTGAKTIYWKEEYPIEYPYTGEFSSKLPDDDEPNKVFIEDTVYFVDWYCFKYSLMPKVYESLKRWVKTKKVGDIEYLLLEDENVVKIWENGVPLYKTNADKFQYLKEGNPHWLNADDDNFLATIDDWIYQWDLYGHTELSNKLEAWSIASKMLFHNTFLASLDDIDLHFYYTPDKKDILFTKTLDKSDPLYITSVTVKQHKNYSFKVEDLTDDEREAIKKSNEDDEICFTLAGWGESFRKWCDYWGYLDRTESEKNTMTNRYKGFKGLGVCIQVQVWIAIRQKEIELIESQQKIYDALRKAIQIDCSYETCDKNSVRFFDANQRTIINQLLSNTDYNNANFLITSLDTIETAVSQQEKLYKFSLNELSKISQPQYSFKTELDNLFSLEEFEPMRNQVRIGNYIYLDKNMYEHDYVKLRIISIEKNPLIDSEELQIEFSSMTKSLNGFSDLSFILSNMSNKGSSNSGGSGTGSGGTFGENDADVRFSNNVLNALLTNSTVKTATVNALVDSLQADSANVSSLIANSGVFDSLRVGNTAISGDCLTAGQIKSTNYSEKERDGKIITTGSVFNLDDGTFSYGNGGLIYDGKDLNINGQINADSGTIGGWYITSDGIANKNIDKDDKGLQEPPTAYLYPNQLYLGNNKGETIFSVDEKKGVIVNAGEFSIGKNYSVNSDGVLKADNAEINGDIVANNLTLNNGLSIGKNLNIDKDGNVKIGNHLYGYVDNINSYIPLITINSIESSTASGTIIDIPNFRIGTDCARISFGMISESPSIGFYGNEGINVEVGGSFYANQLYAGDISASSEVKFPNVFDNALDGTKRALYINDLGELGYSSSSRRFKQDISYELKDFDPDGLYLLKPAQFKYNKESGGGDDSETIIGFIAEDVAECFPPAARWNSDHTQVDTWEVREMIPAMLKLIQTQNDRINQLESKVDELERKLNGNNA